MLCRNLSLSVCEETTRRSVKKHFNVIPRITKPALTPINIAAKLKFIRSHQHWTEENWICVIFTDERKFNRYGTNGIQHKICPEGIKGRTNQYKFKIKFECSGVMVWGGYDCKWR